MLGQGVCQCVRQVLALLDPGPERAVVGLDVVNYAAAVAPKSCHEWSLDPRCVVWPESAFTMGPVWLCLRIYVQDNAVVSGGRCVCQLANSRHLAGKPISCSGIER